MLATYSQENSKKQGNRQLMQPEKKYHYHKNASKQNNNSKKSLKYYEALIKFWTGNLPTLPPAFKKLPSSITNSDMLSNHEFQPSSLMNNLSVQKPTNTT